MTAWENKNLYDRIIDVLDFWKDKYSSFNSSREVITEHFRPDLGIETDNNNKGDFFGESIYEGTGPWAAQTMARGFQENLVSQSIDWIMYIMALFELRGIDALDSWCQDIKDHMTQAYINSNFYDILPQYTLYGITTGSPVVIGEEIVSEQRVIFMPHHWKNCYVIYDKYNRPVGLIIEDPNWTTKQIYDKFIGEGTPEGRKAERTKKLSIEVNSELNNGQHYKEHTIILAIFKSNALIWNTPGFTKPVGDHEWIMVYYEKDTDAGKKNEPLSKEGFFIRPFMVWNYDKKPWEPCSRTPAFYAIWDCRSHQQVHKNYLEGVQLKTRPPRVVLKDMINRIDFDPEGIIDVEKDEYDRPPKALDAIGDVMLDKDLSNVFRSALERHFHIDLFRMFSRLPEFIKQPLTATQIMQMEDEKITLIGGIQTYCKGLLRATDDILMDKEYRAGRGPFNRARMANITDVIMNNIKTPNVESAEVIPEFVGRLARLQKRRQQLDPIRTGAAVAAELAGNLGNPDLPRLAIKEYKALDKALASLDFPQDALYTEDDYEANRDELAQMRARDKQFAQTIEAAKASKGVTGPVDESSILKQITGAGG